MYAVKSLHSKNDFWGDNDDEIDISKDDGKSPKDDDCDDGITTDEDDNKGQKSVEGSVSEPKGGEKGPSSASESKDHLADLMLEDNAQTSSSEPQEIAKGSEVP
jgi:hypothetical protein